MESLRGYFGSWFAQPPASVTDKGAFKSVPPEVILAIFDFLDQPSKSRFMQVCKPFYEDCSSHPFWKGRVKLLNGRILNFSSSHYKVAVCQRLLVKQLEKGIPTIVIQKSLHPRGFRHLSSGDFCVVNGNAVILSGRKQQSITVIDEHSGSGIDLKLSFRHLCCHSPTKVFYTYTTGDYLFAAYERGNDTVIDIWRTIDIQPEASAFRYLYLQDLRVVGRFVFNDGELFIAVNDMHDKPRSCLYSWKIGPKDSQLEPKRSIGFGRKMTCFDVVGTLAFIAFDDHQSIQYDLLTGKSEENYLCVSDCQIVGDKLVYVQDRELHILNLKTRELWLSDFKEHWKIKSSKISNIWFDSNDSLTAIGKFVIVGRSEINQRKYGRENTKENNLFILDTAKDPSDPHMVRGYRLEPSFDCPRGMSLSTLFVSIGLMYGEETRARSSNIQFALDSKGNLRLYSYSGCKLYEISIQEPLLDGSIPT